MNCAWCGTNTDGSDSHGICDTCMQTFFGVNPISIHQEIEGETKDETNVQVPQLQDSLRGYLVR